MTQPASVGYPSHEFFVSPGSLGKTKKLPPQIDGGPANAVWRARQLGRARTVFVLPYPGGLDKKFATAIDTLTKAGRFLRVAVRALFFIVALLGPLEACAADYYVSSSTGNDRNNGLSPQKPFKTPARISRKDFLKCGDSVLFKKGDVWEGKEADASNIDSSCARSDRPIVIGAYGEGPRPILYGAAVHTGPWTRKTGEIYVTAADHPVRTVSVDDSYALWRMPSPEQMVPQTFYYDETDRKLYVWLADGADPKDHRLRLGEYPKDPFVGLVAARSSAHGDNYEIRDIEIRTSNAAGFFITGKNTRCVGIRADFCASDGWFAAKNSDKGIDAEGSSCDRCIMRYNNTMGNGHGQAMTVYAPRVRITRSLIEMNGMAGVDFLDYHAKNSDVHHGILRDSVVRKNGQWPGENNWDPGVYVDGAHDILIYNNLVEDQGQPRGQRPSPGIKVSNEHPDIKDVRDIYVIGNVSRGNRGQAMVWWTGNSDKIEGSFDVDNDLRPGTHVPDAVLMSDVASEGLSRDVSKLPVWVRDEMARPVDPEAEPVTEN